MSGLQKIDLNSDLGESYGQWTLGDDRAILALVSSANVACGFHAGSPDVIFATVQAAAGQGVAVGAHVSYPDLVGFGRRNMDLSHDELMADVIYQIGALQGMATAAGTRVRYVKPHGALYNTIAHNEKQGLAVIGAIRAVDPTLPLMGLAGSRILTLAAEQGLKTVSEAFADRAYHSDGTLVSRRDAGAVLHDPRQVAERMLRMITEGGVISVEGVFTPVRADSICVHGDSPAAIDMARHIRQLLAANGIAISPFAEAL